MALIKIRVSGIIAIIFTPVYTAFVREVNETKTLLLSYTGGSGQSLTAGQQLYSVGTTGTLGYLSVKVKNATILSGSGSFEIDITSYANATKPDGAINFTYDASPIVINIDYNSKPDAFDFTAEIPNRTVKTFTVLEFESHFSDFDGDSLSDVMVEGDVSGYKFNGNAYISGTWISISDVPLLTYEPNDTDSNYEKINNWKARDITGYISD